MATRINKEFWMGLEKNVLSYDEQMLCDCILWTESIKKELDAMHIKNHIMFYDGPLIHPICNHYWLRVIDPDTDEVIEADRYPVRHEAEYPDGFYGSFDSVQGRLHDIYKQGMKIDKIRKERKSTNLVCRAIGITG